MLLTVIEGVAAAPFLGFAHFDTDGEGLGHKTQYGYTFMLASFMRPLMLVLGFVVATALLEVFGGLMTNMYGSVVRDVQADSVTGLLSIFAFIAIFFVIMAGLVNSVMSVTYILPDAIFSFMGAHSSATAQVGRGQEDAIKNSSAGGFGVGNRMMSSGSADIARMAQQSGGRKDGADIQSGGAGVRPGEL